MKTKFVLSIMIMLAFAFVCAAQSGTEVLNNASIVALTKSGLSNQIIIKKIGESKTVFDLSVSSLVELKNQGVADEVIGAMMDRGTTAKASEVISSNGRAATTSASQANPPSELDNRKEVLRAGKTIFITKNSLFPSLQALEKAFFKRDDWKKLNLNIVRDYSLADLKIDISYVHLTWITHRYVFRVYDLRSGIVIASGETNSWGSLSDNLAREICKKLIPLLGEKPENKNESALGEVRLNSKTGLLN